MNATRIALSLTLAACTTTVVVAQEGAPPVAPQVKKLEVMVGNWHGSGIMRPAPDAPALPWTSVSTSKWVLGGHFVLDSVKIESEGLPAPLIFQSLTGWDVNREKYVSFEMSNGSGGKESTVHFAGDKIIGAGVSVEMGATMSDHWVTEIGDGEMHFKGLRSVDGGAFFVHVEGSMTRGGNGFTVGPKTADYVMGPANEHMQPLGALAGSWEFRGEWTAAPGVEPMPLTGHEKTDTILGGHVVRSKMRGEGGGLDYEALHFMTWSVEDNCIISVGANNMGEYHTAKCWMEGDKMLAVGAGVYQGKPSVSRSVMKLASDQFTWEGHTISGSDEPFLSFTGTWTRAAK